MTNAQDSKSFLLVTCELGGIIAPVMTVAQKLVAAGHTVRVLSDVCNRGDAEAVGARFASWTRAPSRTARKRETELVRGWEHVGPTAEIEALMRDHIVGRASDYANDLIEELRREPADLVIASDFVLGAHVACEALGQPFVVFAANIALFPVPGVPPMGPGLSPAATEDDHALHAAITAGAMDLFDTNLPALNVLRATLDLQPLQHLVDQYRRGRAVLLGTSRAFDFAPDVLPADLHYVGPQLGEPNWAAAWSPPVRQSLRPRVAVAFSTTFQDHGACVQRVIDAIGALPDWDGFVTLGGSLEPHEVRGAPNVEILASAPHRALFEASDIVITHGGHGSVMKALAAQKPLLILPHGRDQHDNAVRVSHRGAGLSLPSDAASADIKAALIRLRSEPAFAAAALELGAAVAAERDGSPIVSLLERFAAGEWRSRMTAPAAIRAA